MAGRRNLKKKEVDLDAMVASGADGAYEALQLYRSKAMRHKTKNDILMAIQTTAHGAKCLLTHSYVNAGAELASIILDLVDESRMEITPQLRTIMFEVDSAYPETSTYRVEFLKGCVKWTIETGNREFGDPATNLRLANCLWAIGDRGATYHFVVSEEPEVLSQRIDVTYSSSEHLTLRERSLTLGVLHFLALENLRDANELFKAFKKTQKSRGFPTDTDLIMFCDYLLQTCRRDAAPLFKALVNAYAPMLDFDEHAPTLLTGPIAQRLFNVQPKANPMMSMLQNLFH